MDSCSTPRNTSNEQTLQFSFGSAVKSINTLDDIIRVVHSNITMYLPYFKHLVRSVLANNSTITILIYYTNKGVF